MSAPPRPARVLVVGAGIAGLTAATSLQVDHEVVVVDKGRGVGGRCATRRVQGAVVDHGAQFLTTHSAEFADMVAAWTRAGVVTPWYTGRVGPRGVEDADGHVRHRGVVSMAAIAKHLGAGADVRTSTRVARLDSRDRHWVVTTGDGEEIAAHAVVLTPPVPQILELLGRSDVAPGPAVADHLDGIGYERCLAALVPLRAGPDLPSPGAVDPDLGAIDWMADNGAKGISARPALTLHATASFSTQRWDDADDPVVADMLAAAGEALGADLADLADPAEWQLHRWRYARPSGHHPRRCLAVADEPLLVLAGDAFGGGAKVEGAALSGSAAAAAVRAASLRATPLS